MKHSATRLDERGVRMIDHNLRKEKLAPSVKEDASEEHSESWEVKELG